MTKNFIKQQKFDDLYGKPSMHKNIQLKTCCLHRKNYLLYFLLDLIVNKRKTLELEMTPYGFICME